MEITEVRIKLMEDPTDRLKAFCSITLDGSFVVRDLKIIQGGKGPFVAMPSRKLTDKCPKCGSKNNLRAAFCNDCGIRLRPDRALKGQDGRAKLYADVAHPINSECRDRIQENVLKAFDDEQVLARQPDYVCRYDDYGEDSFADSDWDMAAPDETSTIPLRAETASGTHRIEPAATGSAGPHSDVDVHGQREVAGRVHADRRRRRAGGESERPDDGFGEGII